MNYRTASSIPYFIAGQENRIQRIVLGPGARKTRGAAAGKLGREIRQYLSGRRRAFSRPPLETAGLSPFTRRVLRETARIPYGQTRTYGEIARRLGCPGASRSVGGALHRNPFPLVIPCHRVVAAGGKLGGFSYGPRLKKALLELEHAL